MDGLRQNTRRELARELRGRGEAPTSSNPGPNRSWRGRTRKPGCNDAIDGGGVQAISAAAVETARERERDRSSAILVIKQEFALEAA